MDTQQVVARFEAERQALALMDHPNIAKVHDGGRTSSGRPYFVMELVKGVPITDYCDHNRAPIRQRLELFVSVCQAVQHAHQKGIIHRDIKPSNVLVMSQDGTPVAKVIDFGVAKAIGQQLTDKTLYTQFSQYLALFEKSTAGRPCGFVWPMQYGFRTQVVLGASLLGQKKYAEAEPMLRQGYQRMSRQPQKEGAVPTPLDSHYLIEASRWLVQLYEEWGKPNEATWWRKEMQRAQAPTVGHEIRRR
jgi:serine/threonine protein kinase